MAGFIRWVITEGAFKVVDGFAARNAMKEKKAYEGRLKDLLALGVDPGVAPLYAESPELYSILRQKIQGAQGSQRGAQSGLENEVALQGPTADDFRYAASRVTPNCQVSTVTEGGVLFDRDGKPIASIYGNEGSGKLNIVDLNARRTEAYDFGNPVGYHKFKEELDAAYSRRVRAAMQANDPSQGLPNAPQGATPPVITQLPRNRYGFVRKGTLAHVMDMFSKGRKRKKRSR